MFFQKELETMSRSKIEEIQLERLNIRCDIAMTVFRFIRKN